MKINEIEGYENYITPFDMANLFNVYDDKKLADNHKVYNINRGIVIEGLENLPAVNISTYKVKEGNTLFGISFELYGTVELWWLLAKINGITNALFTLQSGTTIYTLDIDTVNKILSEITNN